MLGQCSPRNILRRTGVCLLAIVLLAAAGTPKAQAQTTPYDKDWERLKNVIKWVNGAWSFVGGLRSVVGFLTGSDGQPQLTIQDIQETITNALDKKEDDDLIKDVTAFANNFHNIEVEANSVRASIMASSFVTSYLAGSFKALNMTGQSLFDKLNPILRAPSIRENDQRVYRVMPAYTVLVPTMVSTRKLLGEIEPLLKSAQDRLISETLAAATQTLFMAAGAYVLYAHDPRRVPPVFFYSPVGTDDAWMFHRPLYAYNHTYHGQLITVPALRFYQYQAIPIVKLALDSLESIVSVQPSMVWTERAYIWDLFTDPNMSQSKPAFAPSALGWITRVRQ
jgi:hypothetical protein